MKPSEKKILDSVENTEKNELNVLRKAKEKVQGLKALKFKNGNEVIDALKEILKGLELLRKANQADSDRIQMAEQGARSRQGMENQVKSIEAQKIGLFNKMAQSAKILMAKIKSAAPPQLQMKK